MTNTIPSLISTDLSNGDFPTRCVGNQYLKSKSNYAIWLVGLFYFKKPSCEKRALHNYHLLSLHMGVNHLILKQKILPISTNLLKLAEPRDNQDVHTYKTMKGKTCFSFGKRSSIYFAYRVTVLQCFCDDILFYYAACKALQLQY